jgi:DNA-directed RNA polymerase specialized sigma24 family protein
LKTALQRNIDRLPHKEKSLIWHHYVKGQVWSKLSMRHWYSVRQLNNIVSKALSTLGERLEKEPAVQEFLQRREADHTS